MKASKDCKQAWVAFGMAMVFAYGMAPCGLRAEDEDIVKKLAALQAATLDEDEERTIRMRMRAPCAFWTTKRFGACV